VRRAARYAWAVLLARIDEVFPLRCPNGGGEMRIIAFITATTVVRAILLALQRADCAIHQRLASASANRPEVCSPAPQCRAIDPGNCLTTAWTEDRRRSLAAAA